MSGKLVDVVIVNYRTKELTLQAAQSVLKEPDLGKVIVVENGSNDASYAYLKTHLQKDSVTVVESVKNLGFGGGNNLGVKEAKSPYIFFLNSDAFIKTGCLGQLVDVLERNQDVGLVAPAIFLDDEKTLQLDALGIFPTPYTIVTRKTTRPVSSLSPDWISGVAFMVRREEYIKIGGFDERIFLYYEDVDLCRRFRMIGKHTYRCLAAKVVHLGGRSKQSTYTQKEKYFSGQDTYLKLSQVGLFGRVLVKVARFPYRVLGRVFLWK